MAPEEAPLAAMPATARAIDIVLRPLSHPDLGEIRIDDPLFAIGRTEEPFLSYPPQIVDALSRRHARIFSEHGQAYVADLGSKNGTTVNGVRVREQPARLRDGDEICFGGKLAYRVGLAARAGQPRPAARISGLTLAPEHGDHGLQPVVVTRFPFLVGKSDEAFSRYKEAYPHQVNYLSRRHAHIFLKGGLPYVEDLGSTNGTFVAGKRLDEHAVPLQDGDLLAFGGHHFVYRVGLHQEPPLDPTVTRSSPSSPEPAGSPGDSEKTTFVAAADSFLDIFCADQPARQEADNAEPGPTGTDEEGRRRHRLPVFLSELRAAFAGGTGKPGRILGWAGLSAAALGLAAVAIYLRDAPERELMSQLARGEYAQAAKSAGEYLEAHPGNAPIEALATEAVLKADVPAWLAGLKAREFDRAAAILAAMKTVGKRNAELQSLVGELDWMGNLERFVATRGGTEAPIRIYADEDRIKALLKQWDEDPLRHQRAFDTVASQVPEFRDAYAEALSHLRKLQSDDSVYLAAMERLKAEIAAELERDRPEALEAVLKEYAEKYPRLGGLDGVRQDLRQYLEIEGEARARRLGRLAALLEKARFSTPPFQARFRALAASGQLPPAAVTRQYEAVAKAWGAGDAKTALAGLQQIPAGPWAEAAAREAQHKKAVAEGYAGLQQARGGKGYGERLLAFYESLDPEEDVYFLRAIAADLDRHRDQALRRAQEFMNRAQALWSRYRENGAIAEEQRQEAAVSSAYRNQARLLAEARDNVQRSLRLYDQLKADYPAQWNRVRDEIEGEAEMQRRALLALRPVLDPEALEAKLALIGGRSDEQKP